MLREIKDSHDSLNDRAAKIEESKNVTQTPSKPVEPADQNRSFEEETRLRKKAARGSLMTPSAPSRQTKRQIWEI